LQAKLSTTLVKSLTPKPKPYEVVDTEVKGFLLRVQPSGAMSYYFAYRTESGVRKRMKLGVHGPACTVAMARDAATAAAGDVTRGVDVQSEKKARVANAVELRNRTLGVFLEDHYGPWVIAHQKAGAETVARIKQAFAEFLNMPLEDVNLRRIDRYRTDAIGRGLKPSSINRTVTNLQGLLSRAVEWGVISEHPLQGMKALKVDNRPRVRFLSDEEESSLTKALDQRDQRLKDARSSANKHRLDRGYPLLQDLAEHAYADRLTPMVLISLKTGLRKGEILDLRWSDVDLDARLLTVRGEDSKSGNTRYVPLNPTALAALTSWRRQSGKSNQRVFPANDGGRLDNVRSSWATLLSDAGIEKFRWHDMRHHFASKLVMKGVPLNTVRELCGHADSNTTLRYAHLAQSHVFDAVNLLDEVS
jgi:integrase